MVVKLKSSGTNISPLIGVFVLLTAVLITWLIVWQLNNPIESEVVLDPKPLRTTIASKVFYIPANMYRFRIQRKERTVNRVDLVMRWPELEGYTELNQSLIQANNSKDLIFMTIGKHDSTLSPEDRLKTIYSKFLGATIPAPDGLVGKKFISDSGYDNEELYYENSENAPYIARCLPEDSVDIMPMCLREVKLSKDVYMIYSFHRALLNDWQNLDTTLQKQFLKKQN